MANTEVQSELLAIVQRGTATEDLLRLRGQMEQLTQVVGQQAASVKDNTDAVARNTTAHSSTAASTAGSIAKTVSQGLGIGTFLSPLITGIAKLFGKKSEPALPELVQIQRPSSISVEAATGPYGSSALSGVDYGQDNLPRRISAPVQQQATLAESAAPANPQPQITIQIQALDSQSLLDRSDDLARAVRHAMLQSSGLNSVITEM